MRIEFRILGPLELSADGRLLPLGSPKQRALLGLLLVHANETVSRDRLIEELWGELPPATVESALHVYLSRLRRLLESAGERDLLVRQAHGYRLEVEPEQLDANRFERLAGEGSAALAAGKAEVAGERFREALALWRGPALADLQSERFAATAAARLDEQRVSALEQRLEADLVLGRDRELIGELETLVAEHPYRERLRAELMLALYRSGRQAEALRAYQEARRVLVDELGLEPSRRLQDLERAILTHDDALDGSGRTEHEEATRPVAATGREERNESRSRPGPSLLLSGLRATIRRRRSREPVNLIGSRIQNMSRLSPSLELQAALRALGGAVVQGGRHLGEAQGFLRSVDPRELKRRFDELTDGRFLTEEEVQLADDLARQIHALRCLAELRPMLDDAIEQIDTRSKQIRGEILRARLGHSLAEGLVVEVKALCESLLSLCTQLEEAEQEVRSAPSRTRSRPRRRPRNP